MIYTNKCKRGFTSVCDFVCMHMYLFSFYIKVSIVWNDVRAVHYFIVQQCYILPINVSGKPSPVISVSESIINDKIPTPQVRVNDLWSMTPFVMNELIYMGVSNWGQLMEGNVLAKMVKNCIKISKSTFWGHDHGGDVWERLTSFSVMGIPLPHHAHSQTHTRGNLELCRYRI